MVVKHVVYFQPKHQVSLEQVQIKHDRIEIVGEGLNVYKKQQTS